MNLRDVKFTVFAKYMAIATIIVLFLSQTPVWQYLKSGLRPLIIAFIIAYILDYSVRFFESKLRLPRSIAILMSFLIFIGLIGMLGVVVVPSIIEAVSSLIKTISAVNFDMDVDFSFIQQIDFDNIYLQQFQQSVIDTIAPILQRLTNITGSAVLLIVTEIQKITSGVISFILALVIAIYMLAEKKDLSARIRRFVFAYCTDRQVHWVFYVANLSNRIFKDFVIGKLIDSTIIGFLSYFIFQYFNFQYAVLIALIVGITNMIPYFGPFIGAVPAAIITLIATPSNPVNVIYMIFLIFLIQQLDGLLIGPLILGDSVGVSAFWIITAVTIGGATFGILGMFLGVPVFVLLKTLIEEDVERKLEAKGYPAFEKENLKLKKTKHLRKSKA
ncbi:MAG TPA: hypothetical protein DCS67_02080 [Clostridiales bacterium UBA8960]|jgi:predicted PurR-regulated permease PerM|nr:hypothetical protein [Clostridiales bacterium UBA8960]